MRGIHIFAVVFVLGASCTGHPMENLPVLKEAPAEVLFRVADDAQPFTLECMPAVPGDGVRFKNYVWMKNGIEFSHSPDEDVIQRKNEGTLVFLRPKASDEGYYQCLYKTPYGVATTRVIQARRTYLSIAKYNVKNHTPVEGRPFKLECPLPKAYPKPSIEWRSVLAADPTMSDEIRDKRITVGPDGSLYFSNITLKDTSDRFKYVCLAKSPAVDEPVPVAEHFITGMAADHETKDNEVVKQYASPDTTAKVGETLYLYCIYGGNPLAHPDWYKDGTNVNNSPGDRVTRYNKSVGKRLLIRDVVPEDAGIYTCVVDNEVGKQQNHTIKLTVVGAPKFVQKPEKKMNVAEGDDVTIPCEVSGMPAPKMSYTYNSGVLGDRAVVGQNGVTIKKIQKSDIGYYGCGAFNDYGSEYAETLLYVA